MSEWTEAETLIFWRRMIEIYGKRFATEHGEQINDTWKMAVSALRYEQVKYGLEQCLRSGDEFVPTLAQFMYRARSMPATQPYARLSRPRIDPEIQRTRISDAVAAARAGVGRRCVLLPGESNADYMHARQVSGLCVAKFDAQRLKVNGWTPAMEAIYRDNAHCVGYRIDDGRD